MPRYREAVSSAEAVTPGEKVRYYGPVSFLRRRKKLRRAGHWLRRSGANEPFLGATEGWKKQDGRP